jgi:hypothetical protein
LVDERVQIDRQTRIQVAIAARRVEPKLAYCAAVNVRFGHGFVEIEIVVLLFGGRRLACLFAVTPSDSQLRVGFVVDVFLFVRLFGACVWNALA